MEIFYQKMLKQIKKHLYLKQICIKSTKYIPIITFIIYPTTLLGLLIGKSNLFLPTLIKPLISFLTVTLIRKMVNRPRPYEAMKIEPLIIHKKGESFPSRHTVSAFAIALVCLKVNLSLGIIMLILATIVSLSRILCGVHYISDVITAIVIAVCINYLL